MPGAKQGGEGRTPSFTWRGPLGQLPRVRSRLRARSWVGDCRQRGDGTTAHNPVPVPSSSRASPGHRSFTR